MIEWDATFFFASGTARARIVLEMIATLMGYSFSLEIVKPLYFHCGRAVCGCEQTYNLQIITHGTRCDTTPRRLLAFPSDDVF